MSKMKRYKFKVAIISGCYCYEIKKYLSMTRRFIINGYELTKIVNQIENINKKLTEQIQQIETVLNKYNLTR